MRVGEAGCNFPRRSSYLEWINVSAFSASVNHESVKASISARNCNQASLLAGPSRPEDAEGETLFRLEPAKDFAVYSDGVGGSGAVWRGGVGGALTSDVIFVGGVDLFYPPVAEGQFPHPVHAAPHARGQAEVGAGGGRVEAVGGEVVRAKAEAERGKGCQRGGGARARREKKKGKIGHLRSWPLSSEDTSSMCT